MSTTTDHVQTRSNGTAAWAPASVAEQVVQVLRQAGVERIYGVVGDSLNPIVDLVTDPNALSIPPHITPEQVTGFALAESKIVLGGGVGRMLDLARSNLRTIPRP
jgi:hypothetical protein